MYNEITISCQIINNIIENGIFKANERRCQKALENYVTHFPYSLSEKG